MTTVFKKKGYATQGLYAIIDMVEIYEEKAIELIKCEKRANIYKSAKIDDMIRLCMMIFKKDIRVVINALGVHLRDQNVSSSALYSIINATAVESMIDGIRWVDNIQNQNLVKEITYNTKMPIEEWLMSSGIGFDETKYKRDQEREKDKALNHKINRHAASQLQNWANSVQNATKSSTTNTKKSSRPNRPKKGSFKKVLSEVTAMFNIYRPNLKWDKSICAFYHHNDYECRYGSNIDCPRNHICPICSGAHTISECPNKET